MTEEVEEDDGYDRSMSAEASKLLCSPPSSVQRPIFPSLQQIGPSAPLRLSSPEDMSALSMFLGSELLTSISIEISDFQDYKAAIANTFYPILYTLETRHLKRLHLYLPSRDVADEKLRFISEMTNLEDFAYGGLLSWDLMAIIGFLPKLKRLYVTGLSSGPSGESHLTGGWLPQLEELRLSTMGALEAKIFRCCPPRLRKVNISDTRTTQDLHHLITVAVNQEATLEELNVGVLNATIQYADLRGLSQYQNLRTLEIFGFNCLVLDDEQLREIIKCLPKLQYFALDQYKPPTSSSDTQLSLLSLRHIVQYCDSIREITMRLRATEIPDLPVRNFPQNSPTCQETLVLSVGVFGVSDPEGVAAWLVQCFARFELVEMYHPYGADNTVLTVFRTLREEWERKSVVKSTEYPA